MKGISRFIVGALGMGDVYVPIRKEFVATAMAIGAGVSALSSIIGGAAARRKARQAQREREAAEAKEAAWYARRYNEDYSDTAAGQNLIRRAKDYARNQWKKAAGAQAVAGGTDAATQMAKDAGNKMVGDTLANIAATDQARKSQVDNIHMQNDQNFALQRQNEQMQAAQNITSAAGAASNAIMQGAMAFEPNLAGGSNKSVPKGMV